MDERVINFNENQLKKSGFGEAFTPELKAQLEEGKPFITHTFNKEYDGDKLEATLYLKKSFISDYYSLKAFDLKLKKEGVLNPVQHTFKITDTNFGTLQINEKHLSDENRYTLKEAYNLLAGRSVYKNLKNAEGKQEHAWVRLNIHGQPKTVDQEHRLYQTKYGFDLERELNKYAIKELRLERTKQSLIKSLQRGNIKKVTFVGPKKHEERLYISPNIILGCLDVRDKNKQRLSTGELIERKFLGKDFALKIDDDFKRAEKVRSRQSDIKPSNENVKAVVQKELPHNAARIQQKVRLKQQ